MRAALAVSACEAIVLVALAFAQFDTREALGRSIDRTVDPLSDPLVSILGRIQVVLWLAAPPLIGMLVARAGGRELSAAGLAFLAPASAAVVSPLLEQLVASGWVLLDSGQGPRGVYFFVPPGGWTPDSAYLPLLIPIAIVIGGGIAALEAALATWLARHRLRGTA